MIYKEIGIKNFKNNCFANSFIQILLLLKSFIINFYNKLKDNIDKDNTIFFQLYLFCEEYKNIY
jgi:ubiquitin C-terminal hydrolase